MSTAQKSLLGFFENEEKEEKKGVVKEKEIAVERIKDDGKKKSNQIETDYYDKSRIETCAKVLRERFNVNIEILPVMYGKDPKIYGYYMIITIKSGDKNRIEEFIRDEYKLKVY